MSKRNRLSQRRLYESPPRAHFSSFGLRDSFVRRSLAFVTFYCRMTALPFILAAEGVSKTFEGFKAISDLNFYMDEGELRTVIGPNGAGKTTFLDLITGRTKPDAGSIR